MTRSLSLSLCQLFLRAFKGTRDVEVLFGEHELTVEQLVRAVGVSLKVPCPLLPFFLSSSRTVVNPQAREADMRAVMENLDEIVRRAVDEGQARDTEDTEKDGSLLCTRVSSPGLSEASLEDSRLRHRSSSLPDRAAESVV